MATSIVWMGKSLRIADTCCLSPHKRIGRPRVAHRVPNRVAHRVPPTDFRAQIRRAGMLLEAADSEGSAANYRAPWRADLCRDPKPASEGRATNSPRLQLRRAELRIHRGCCFGGRAELRIRRGCCFGGQSTNSPRLLLRREGKATNPQRLLMLSDAGADSNFGGRCSWCRAR